MSVAYSFIKFLKKSGVLSNKDITVYVQLLKKMLEPYAKSKKNIDDNTYSDQTILTLSEFL